MLMEGLVVLSMVLVAYILIMGILERVFPYGSSVNQILTGEGLLSDFSLLDDRDQQLMVNIGTSSEVLGIGKQYSAAISEKTNSVKVKNSGSVIWKPASKGARLADRDAVQTFKESSAIIQLNNNNFVNLGENSLLVINDLTSDQVLQEKRTRVIMLAGEIRGRISGDAQDSIQLEVKSSGITTAIRSVDTTDPTEFKVQVNPDKTSTITVMEGLAEVTSQEQIAKIETNQALTVSGDNFTTDTEIIPQIVALVSPKNLARYFYKDFPGKVTFDWKQQDDADSYVFELARDKNFRKPVVRKIINETHYNHSNLKKGEYYWRVGAKRQLLEGKPSPAVKIVVVQDQKPPKLQVSFPPDGINKNSFKIKGKSESGAVVFINNQPARLDRKGNFSHAITITKGVNIIVVEAIDQAGNVNYKSKTINARY